MLELDYATNYLFLHEVKVCVTHSCSYKLYEYLICLRLIECNILNLQWVTGLIQNSSLYWFSSFQFIFVGCLDFPVHPLS